MSAEDDVGMPPYRPSMPMPMPEPGRPAPDAHQQEMPSFEIPQLDMGEDEEDEEEEEGE